MSNRPPKRRCRWNARPREQRPLQRRRHAAKVRLRANQRTERECRALLALIGPLTEHEAPRIATLSLRSRFQLDYLQSLRRQRLILEKAGHV